MSSKDGSKGRKVAPRRRGVGRTEELPGTTGDLPGAAAAATVTVTPRSIIPQMFEMQAPQQQTRRLAGRRGPPSEKEPSEPQRMTPPGDTSSPAYAKEPTQEMESLKLAERTGKGTLGKRYKMRTNHFEINFERPAEGLKVYNYNIAISHERMRLNPDDNRLILSKCVTEHEEIFGDDGFLLAYDGRTELFSKKQFNFPTDTARLSFRVHTSVPRDDQVQEFTCDVEAKGETEVDIGTVGIAPDARQTLRPVQILDIIFRQYRSHPYGGLENVFYPFRSNVYKIPHPRGEDLRYGKEIWQGFYQAVRVCEEKRAFLNVDAKFGAFYHQNREDGTGDYEAIDFMIDVLNSNADRNLYRRQDLRLMRTPLSNNLLDVLKKEFTGVFVRTTHRDGANQRKRVIGLSAPPTMSKFKDKKGNETTVQDYFKNTYSIEVYPFLPTLNIGTKTKPVSAPMDVCVIGKKQRVMKKLNENQTAIVVKTATSGGAPKRFERTNDLFKEARFVEDPFLKKFNLKVKPQMTTVEGRVLPVPAIVQRERQRPSSSGEINKGTKICAQLDMQNAYRFDGASFAKASIIKSVGCVYCGLSRDYQKCQNFIQQQLRALNEMGCRVPLTPDVEVPVTFTTDVNANANAVKGGLEECKNELDKKGKPLVEDGVICGIVFVLVPVKDSVIYAVKETAEIEMGIMTQVVQFRTFTKNATANIALKVNLKMQGLNAEVEPPEIICEKFYYAVPTLLIGIDVTHPSPLDKESPSIAAVVSNVDSNRNSFQFACSIKIQSHQRETVVYLVDVVKNRLISYFKKMKVKPARIIVYRDGVSEGQFGEVAAEEIRGIRDACLALDDKYRPKITYIVVTKRHNTRLYPVDKGFGRAQNVEPGVVLDNTIVSGDVFDFYLCSHFGIQGTSRPAKYTVLADDSNFNADEIQLITYYTTFMYERAARSVSIPAPVYYADLACTRARVHLYSLIASFSDTRSETASSASREARGPIQEGDLVNHTTVKNPLLDKMYFT